MQFAAKAWNKYYYWKKIHQLKKTDNFQDMSGYNKLNKICDDCFALYKEPEVYTFCRWSAFPITWLA